MTAGVAPPVPKTFTSEGTISQYRFVKFNSTNPNKVEECDSQGEAAIGVCAEDSTDETAVSIWLLGDGGIIPVEAASSITSAAQITTTADGSAETSAGSDNVLGFAVEAASGDGHVIGMIPEFAGRTS